MNNYIQMPERIHVEETSSKNHARFVMQPLEQGYGVTIGNSLRRVLLSSIPGTAIIGLKITDVHHEFQTVPGVIEDTTDIIINIKQIRINQIDKKNNRVNLHIKGPGVWKASDIQDASGGMLEIMDPELVICHLAEDADFDVELRLATGKGYVPAEEQVTTDFPVGMLPIDSIHTPIKNVVFHVDPFRVGQKTDYEKLILDVITDGTIPPVDALHSASKILNDHMKYFIAYEDEEESVLPPIKAEDDSKQAEINRIRKILLTPVEELELSVRAHNCLKAASIKTLSGLVALQESELLKFRNFGKKSLSELTEVVANSGLEFGMNVEYYLREEPKSLILE